MELLETSSVLCKQGATDSSPATSAKPVDRTRFIEFVFRLFSRYTRTVQNRTASERLATAVPRRPSKDTARTSQSWLLKK